MKFGDGYMIKTGNPGQVYTDTAVRHVAMRQGMIGIKVSIMLPHDPAGVNGPKIPLDDVVTILEPKEEPSPEEILLSLLLGKKLLLKSCGLSSSSSSLSSLLLLEN